MFSEQMTRKTSLLVCYLARVCLSAKDAEAELQNLAEEYKLTRTEEDEVRKLVSEENKRG